MGLIGQIKKPRVCFLKDVAEFCEERTILEELETVNFMGAIAALPQIPQLPHFSPYGALAASCLFSCLWFFRIWAVQEISAGQEAMVSIGSFCIPSLSGNGNGNGNGRGFGGSAQRVSYVAEAACTARGLS
ncbi:hypothetical protein GQ43DRAFT_429180 [Delitschia confertaspora ATCC 74209]|uniref:Uncharacterized protein n=1 Tax=Delitschia confertaspora ATCC 74209 TaxID=1513339 RepID=A0A9P4MVJ1_9PLEO|nr:hypothetical protein GQ43DRAFT_429180 [Delitschia confertaspora ATCC 74209]